MVAWLDQEGDPALEHGVVPRLLHLVHVAASLDAPGRGGHPLPLTVVVKVDPPTPLPVVVSPAQQGGPLSHRPGQAGAGVAQLQGEVRLGEMIKPVGEDNVERKY